MKIALIGYGKMGRAIERIAAERGHETVLRISTANKADMTPDALRNADVAIEFTTPEAGKENVLACLDAGVNVVCGSTGWNQQMGEANAAANSGKGAFLFASNFSLGVNLFFEVNKLLARLMKGRDEYKVAVDETHHVHKKDAPGGTAITIAEQIAAAMDNKAGWALAEEARPEQIPITAHRVGEVPGTHRVTYESEIDTIDIIHTAHSRSGFALGAVLAAEYLAGKQPGVYTMRDVLGIS